MRAADETEHDSCLACGGEQIDRGVPNIDGVCAGCGFVVDQGRRENPLDWTNEAEDHGDDSNEDWLDYCKVTNATEQTLCLAFEAIETIAGRLGIRDDYRREAAQIYARASLAGTTDGRKTSSFVAACIRLGALEVGEPIPLGRLTQLESVCGDLLRSSTDAIRDDLELSTTTTSPEDYVHFFQTTLELEETETLKLRQSLDSLADETILRGKNPCGVIAAVAYGLGYVPTQRLAAEVAGVSVETVRSRLREIEELDDSD